MSDSVVACGNCGELLNEQLNTPVDDRRPCPKCGSRSRTSFQDMAAVPPAPSSSLSSAVTSYPKALLMIAKNLIDQGHFSTAIITTHMACDLAAERALHVALEAKDLGRSGVAPDDLIKRRSLGNDEHRKLYAALTGRELEQQPFWPEFGKISNKRNGIVHSGEQADRAEAESAMKTAEALISYLNQM